MPQEKGKSLTLSVSNAAPLTAPYLKKWLQRQAKDHGIVNQYHTTPRPAPGDMLAMLVDQYEEVLIEMISEISRKAKG